MSQEQCGHTQIVRVTETNPQPGGTQWTTEYWKCTHCGTRFWPETVDMHRIRLRDQFAMTMLGPVEVEALIKEATFKTGKPMSLAELRYFFAASMLLERDKKS